MNHDKNANVRKISRIHGTVKLICRRIFCDVKWELQMTQKSTVTSQWNYEITVP